MLLEIDGLFGIKVRLFTGGQYCCACAIVVNGVKSLDANADDTKPTQSIVITGSDFFII